ncbi:protein RETARDED ROOT GROWTH-LIKE-like [Macadamia integrifolia]|uniref:protein RETARDED ROOT GROWTH-LIKE-like n=1 Tax=Macadamia integrifolia TaxID=60698 RepID=UPI001C52994B|nr:protein RETARDED ROOT GROWTH-LIKE-like [Macadamia integrifolia]XP_042476946.1 protein RETARDED ROOT GROWTH-LIKE-like [Macadamia integrifolia]XP_042476947.1 protein RETARDED ROOT GROWTH-LIKE-like [Macadamia integrifolia]XP_042476948.1 protein RETARDED ROOT GROWTH-LIKE-like [Macadamia integrifolia]
MKMWRNRSIYNHLSTTMLRLSPPLYSSTVSALVRQFSRANPCLVSPGFLHRLSTTKTLNLQRNVIPLILNPRNYSFSYNHAVFFTVRCLSSTPSASTLDWNEPVSCSEIGDGYNSKVNEVVNVGETTPSIPVRAYFFSTSVDLRSLIDQNKANFIPPTSRMTNYVVLRFGVTKFDADGSEASLSGSDCCYMVVFQYGSIVLFNVRDHEVDGYLKIVERHASGLLPEMRKDEYEVREKPTLNTWMHGGLDYIMLQHLNIDGIRTIGSVLGQSIALDYYVRQVDGMVAEFTDINRGMEKTGTFTMERKKLFQLVGKANSNLADVILKLGLFERSDIAWKDAKFAQIWEFLRDEFELTQRFASLDFKLKFVEHNIRFLQEILQNRKSDFLEWLIIILIGAEILISVYDIAHKSL